MSMSTELEAISLLIIAVLAVFHYDEHSRNNRRYRLYNWCLFLSGMTIALNIVSCFIIDGLIALPMWANILANSLCFVAITLALSMLAGYAYFLLYENNPDRDSFKRLITVVMMFGVVLLTLVIVNLWTGCYFYFEGNIYCRGPLNRIGFGVLIIELIILCICYFNNKDIVSPGIHQLMQSMPPLIIILVIGQLILPDLLLTGTLTAFANMIFFACFQNNRIGRDALTEIPNRSSFFMDLASRRKKGHRQHIILVNLNDYARVNRRFGMRQGDSLLYIIARYLDNLGDGYQAYRFGNTRFMILGNYKTMEAAEQIADKIQKRFLDGWEINGRECMIQIQLLHMCLDKADLDDNLLIEQLDYMHLYAKEIQGKSRITRVYFDERLRNMFERKRYVLDEIRNALRHESFQLYFQPVYSCKEERFTTAEVLLRLFARDGQAISPGEFIPLAEEKGLIDDISWMVLKKVCKFLSEHPDLPLESVSMNMSIQQMMDRHICQRIHNYKNQYDIAPEKLRIEITESVVAENPMLVSYVMKNLCAEGIRFYLDDFGVGYSNLAGMMNFPFETVKLDRSIVSGIENNTQKYQTVELLVKMLHNAGFYTVAEGIETEEQVKKAKELGFDRIQGFYYARPMDGDSLVTFLNKE